MGKHITQFKSFLENEVTLNKSRITKLNGHVESIKKFLLTSHIKIKDIFPLGSYAQETIIKPAKNNKEFDADVIVRMKIINTWEAKDYVENLYNIFKNNPIYSSMISRKSRCVTLNYSGDFHLDVVPLLKESGFFSSNRYYITNRITNKYEQTNPYEYNSWLLMNNGIIPNNNFLNSIKLFKYLRDSKQNFTVKSVLLNTLLANMVYHSDKGNRDGNFNDLPSTFKILINRLDDWLQENITMPIIINPSLGSENFNRHWDEVKYQNFRSKIAFYCEKVNMAYSEKKQKLSLQKWQDIFGGNFGK